MMQKVIAKWQNITSSLEEQLPIIEAVEVSAISFPHCQQKEV